MKRILVIIIAIVGLSIPTMAQRLLPHQKGIEFLWWCTFTET